MTKRLGPAVTPWLLLLPALTLLVAFTHWPALATVVDSVFSTAKKGRPSHFIGIENYRSMVQDDVFWQALWNNACYAVAHRAALDRAGDRDGALGQQPHPRPRPAAPGLFHADRAADDRRRQHLALLLHAAVRPARAGRRSALGLASHNWLGDKHTVLGAIIVVAVWKEAGFFMIFYLAALQQIPPQLAEAAALEGASRGQLSSAACCFRC